MNKHIQIRHKGPDYNNDKPKPSKIAPPPPKPKK